MPCLRVRCLHPLQEAAGALIQVSLAFRLTTRPGSSGSHGDCRLHFFPSLFIALTESFDSKFSLYRELRSSVNWNALVHTEG